MLIKHRNLFRITRVILLKLPLLMRFLSRFRNPGSKKVLILKTDAIGDYVIFRNFLEVIRSSDRFKGYQVHLLGNELWKDIALEYDRDYADSFIFVKPNDLYQSPLKTISIAFHLFKQNYCTVLQPTHSRTFIADSLAAFTAAKGIIGFEGDTERIAIKYKVKTDRFYTRRLMLLPGIDFEFGRFCFFFENVLQQSIALSGPVIAAGETLNKGIIIFPGTGFPGRNWSPDGFVELIKLISIHTMESVFLAGGPGDEAAGVYITARLPPGTIHNLIGTTTLPEVIKLIGNARLVIAGETGAIHIAAATGTTAVCILGGGHFGRFMPYPENYPNRPINVFQKMACFTCDWKCIFNREVSEPFPCIGHIDLQSVWQAVLPFLN